MLYMQVRLEPRLQREILSELRTADRIRENLDVVDIVIGFLSSGGGKAEKPLGEYIDRVLKMRRRPFCQKVRTVSSDEYHKKVTWKSVFYQS